MKMNFLAMAFGLALSSLACSASAQAPAAKFVAPVANVVCPTAGNPGAELCDLDSRARKSCATATSQAEWSACMSKFVGTQPLDCKLASAANQSNCAGANAAKAKASGAAPSAPGFVPPVPGPCPAAGTAGAEQCELTNRGLLACAKSASSSDLGSCMSKFMASNFFDCKLTLPQQVSACASSNIAKAKAAGLPPPPPPFTAPGARTCPAPGTAGADLCELENRGIKACVSMTSQFDFTNCMSKFASTNFMDCKLAPMDKIPACITDNAAKGKASGLTPPPPPFFAPGVHTCPAAGTGGAEMCDLDNRALKACATTQSPAEFSACMSKFTSSNFMDCKLAPAVTAAACASANASKAKMIGQAPPSATATATAPVFTPPPVRPCPPANTGGAEQCDLEARGSKACGSVANMNEFSACMGKWMATQKFNCKLAPAAAQAACEVANQKRQ